MLWTCWGVHTSRVVNASSSIVVSFNKIKWNKIFARIRNSSLKSIFARFIDFFHLFLCLLNMSHCSRLILEEAKKRIDLLLSIKWKAEDDRRLAAESPNEPTDDGRERIVKIVKSELSHIDNVDWFQLKSWPQKINKEKKKLIKINESTN